MKRVNLQASVSFVGRLVLAATMVACSQSSLTTNDGGSTLNAFNVNGSVKQVSVAELQSTKLGAVLAAPENCRGFVNQAMTVGLWAGYTDDENKWGKARAKCSVKDGGTYCQQDNSFFGENTSGGPTMGMEVPRVFELGSTVQYLCMSAGRAVGLVGGATRSRSLSNDQVTVEHVANLTASSNGQERSLSDVYVISITSTNSKTNHRLEKKLYFTGEGMPIGARNSQAQSYNEDVQKQTAELHFVYPNTQSVLGEPRL